MTATGPDIAHRFTAAFNAGDVDGLLGCFTSDAVYADLFYGRFTGRSGLRRLFERMYSEGEQYEWIMTEVAATPGCTIGEWRFSFTASAAVPRSSGRRLSYEGASVFQTRGGLCCAYREYFDRGAALLAMGMSPAAMARIAAARPSIQVSGPDLAAYP